MREKVIRPTMKFVYVRYVIVALIVVAIVVASRYLQWPEGIPLRWRPWIPWSSMLLLLWPLSRHFRTRLVKMTILDDKLRYETGLMSKTTRTVLLTRVQDVTVRQSLSQRIFGVGDLSMETAGESSGETIFNIDRPHEVADLINQLSQSGTTTAPPAAEVSEPPTEAKN